jgi:hypothetical protein
MLMTSTFVPTEQFICSSVHFEKLATVRLVTLEMNISEIPSSGRDSSVGIATGWTARVRFPAVRDFSLLHSVQTGSEVHPASYPMGGAWGSFPGRKAAGA